MLSRIAESMFWIGRYVERGDNTARMVQTQLRLIAEDTSRGESDSCRNLLALMSIDDEDYPEPTPPTCCGCSAGTPASRPRSSTPGPPPGTTPDGPGR